MRPLRAMSWLVGVLAISLCGATQWAQGDDECTTCGEACSADPVFVQPDRRSNIPLINALRQLEGARGKRQDGLRISDLLTQASEQKVRQQALTPSSSTRPPVPATKIQ